MIHPLIRLLASEPHLVAEHLGAYFSLIGREAQDAKTEWLARVILGSLSVCSIGVAAVLAGVAVMLWAVTPGLSEQAQWVLGAVPAVALLVAVVSGWLAKRKSGPSAFSEVQQQVSADLRMLKEVIEP